MTKYKNLTESTVKIIAEELGIAPDFVGVKPIYANGKPKGKAEYKYMSLAAVIASNPAYQADITLDELVTLLHADGHDASRNTIAIARRAWRDSQV